MSERLLAGDVLTSELDEALPAGVELLAGSPVARMRQLGSLGATEVGLWEMTAGAARDVEGDEVFLVLAGRGWLSFPDGESIELCPGVLVRLRAGEETRWQVEAPLRKLYLSL